MSGFRLTFLMLLVLALCAVLVVGRAEPIDLGDWDLSEVSSLSIVSRSIKVRRQYFEEI